MKLKLIKREFSMKETWINTDKILYICTRDDPRQHHVLILDNDEVIDIARESVLELVGIK